MEKSQSVLSIAIRLIESPIRSSRRDALGDKFSTHWNHVQVFIQFRQFTSALGTADQLRATICSH